MAIITPSSLISEIRGSAGNQTFSKNRYRTYVKNRVAPTDTPSTYKTTARAYMTNATAAWQSMSDAQRTAWNVNAYQFNSKMRLGLQKPLSGFNYFTRYAILSQYAQLEINTVPGSPMPLPSFQYLSFNAFTGNMSFDLQPQFSNANLVVHIYASPPLSQAIQSVNSTQMLWLKSEGLSSGLNTAVFTDEWEDRFGPLSGYEHARVFAGIKIMDISSGSISPMIVQKNFIDGETPPIVYPELLTQTIHVDGTESGDFTEGEQTASIAEADAEMFARFYCSPPQSANSPRPAFEDFIAMGDAICDTTDLFLDISIAWEFEFGSAGSNAEKYIFGAIRFTPDFVNYSEPAYTDAFQIITF